MNKKPHILRRLKSKVLKWLLPAEKNWKLDDGRMVFGRKLTESGGEEEEEMKAIVEGERKGESNAEGGATMEIKVRTGEKTKGKEKEERN